MWQCALSEWPVDCELLLNDIPVCFCIAVHMPHLPTILFRKFCINWLDVDL
jgi:hypothetical protein